MRDVCGSTRIGDAPLLGITFILSRSHSHDEDEKDLENLSGCVVGIFVKGGGKSPDLDEDDVVAIISGMTEKAAEEGLRSTWGLSRLVLNTLERRTEEMQHSDDSVRQEKVRARTRINSTYLLALFYSSPSSSPSFSSFKQPNFALTSLSTLGTLFARCVELGLCETKELGRELV